MASVPPAQIAIGEDFLYCVKAAGFASGSASPVADRRPHRVKFVAYQDYNPAARLHTVLSEAFVHRGEGVAAAPIWGQILGIDWQAEKSFMLRAGADLQDLTAEVKSTVMGLTGTVNSDLALRHYNEVEATLDQWTNIANLNMQQFMAPLQGTGLYSVEVCADALKQHASEPALGPDAIGSLLEKVHELQREVEEADDLDGATKAWITQRLVDIERALTTYKVTGTRGLERATDELLGGMHRRPGMLARLGASKTALGIGLLLSLIQTTLQGVSTYEQISAPPPAGLVVVVEQLAPGANIPSLPVAPSITAGNADG